MSDPFDHLRGLVFSLLPPAFVILLVGAFLHPPDLTGLRRPPTSWPRGGLQRSFSLPRADRRAFERVLLLHLLSRSDVGAVESLPPGDHHATIVGTTRRSFFDGWHFFKIELRCPQGATDMSVEISTVPVIRLFPFRTQGYSRPALIDLLAVRVQALHVVAPPQAEA